MFEGSGYKVLGKALPRAADRRRPMLFEVSVVRGFDPYPNPRDLGIIVPFSAAIEVRRRRKSGRRNGDRLVDGMGFEKKDPTENK
jgi:hypothetical protein